MTDIRNEVRADEIDRLRAQKAELLAALEYMEYLLGGETSTVRKRFADARRDARAAIAKARGDL